MTRAPALCSRGDLVSWQARKVRYRIHHKRSTFARSGRDFVAGTFASEDRLFDRRSTFARSSMGLVSGAALLKDGEIDR